jgi:hypothetical protein
MNTIFGDFDVSDFWKDSEYANEEYVGDSLTDAFGQVYRG